MKKFISIVLVICTIFSLSSVAVTANSIAQESSIEITQLIDFPSNAGFMLDDKAQAVQMQIDDEEYIM